MWVELALAERTELPVEADPTLEAWLQEGEPFAIAFDALQWLARLDQQNRLTGPMAHRLLDITQDALAKLALGAATE